MRRPTALEPLQDAVVFMDYPRGAASEFTWRHLEIFRH
jgi:hypothetical protein